MGVVSGQRARPSTIDVPPEIRRSKYRVERAQADVWSKAADTFEGESDGSFTHLVVSSNDLGRMELDEDRHPR